MNQWIVRLFSLCAVLLLTGCQPQIQKLLPITGVEEVSLAAPAELARESVLQYILSSSRLETLPPSENWQVEAGEQAEGEYRFRSGDWLMLIRSADTGDAIQKVLIINPVEKASWTGYVTADGHVVDTAYGR